ncbi:SagB family peptide dehydrogenase [Streptomyces sp. ODS05-4]|uniref:SagB family peptide dehydrogenase n=1 Tax=Streptomyces sp. ODS05-4 TaxID=2944939 RepID=UPI00210B839A|nr:SagB family peptide dehydrogenase [Streptomyces sp. ODS05-4]
MIDVTNEMTVDEFWHASLNQNVDMYLADRAGETELPAEPLKFKAYRDGVRYPLDERLPQVLGDARASFPGSAAALPAGESGGRRAGASPARAELSRLLYYTFGHSRLDLGATTWPYHRLVPSARAFFPSELYCWLPADGDRPAGVFYYDPAHHSLVMIRAGEHREILGDALGADLDGARAVLLLSALFWKNAFLYRTYTYRIVPQEIGILAGNALMVAAALGLEGHVHHQFLDVPLNRLVGARSPEESVMAVLPLFDGRRTLRPAPARRLASEVAERISPLDTAYREPSALDEKSCHKLLRMHEASLTHDSTPVAPRAPWPLGAAPALDGAPALAAPADRPEPVELATALRERTSGVWVFNGPTPYLDADGLWTFLRHALSPHTSDLVPDGAPPCTECFVAVHAVDGVEQGVYRLRPGGASGVELQPWRRGPVAAALQDVHYLSPPQIDYARANAVVFLVADRREAAERFGDRGYRIAGQEAGIVAQRICTMSATTGLTARVHNGYRGTSIAEFLGLDPERSVPLFQIVLGRSRPTARYQMPIAV